MRRKIYWFSGIIAVLAIIIYSYYSSAPVVETVMAEKGSIQRTVVDTGYVQLAHNYDLYARQSARIAGLPVSVGQSIEKDQVIMTLENLDLAMESNQLRILLSQTKTVAATAEGALERARVDRDDAQVQFNRTQELFNAGAVSQVELDGARSLLEKSLKTYQEQSDSLNSAREQINTYQKLLASSEQKEADLQVKSPISGTLLQLPVELQQMVVPGTLLARLALEGDLEIKADLLSDDMGEVLEGQKVQVSAPVLGDKALTGKIIKIYPRAEEKQSALGVIQRRVPVIIALDTTGNLKPGYETRVSIITQSRENVILVPREAVRSTGNNQKQLMLVVSGRVIWREVKTGLYDSTNIEITEGLQGGEQLIRDASLSLKDKSRVREY